MRYYSRSSGQRFGRSTNSSLPVVVFVVVAAILSVTLLRVAAPVEAELLSAVEQDGDYDADDGDYDRGSGTSTTASGGGTGRSLGPRRRVVVDHPKFVGRRRLARRQQQQGPRRFVGGGEEEEEEEAYVDRRITVQSNNDDDGNEDGSVRVFVTYANRQGMEYAVSQFVESSSSAADDDLDDEIVYLHGVRAVAGRLPSLQALTRVADHPGVQEVSEDPLMQAAGETTPWNVKLVVDQGDDDDRRRRRLDRNNQKKKRTEREGSTSRGRGRQLAGGGICDDAGSFKVGIVDGGISFDHPDLPCRDALGNCVGQSFPSSIGPWDDPEYYHGVHVAGTLAALRGNGRGVVGVASGSSSSDDDDDICYLIARVLDDDGLGYMSKIMAGIQWVAEQGAMVINVSIVGGGFLDTENRFFKSLWETKGALVVAAAGNAGDFSYAYPASYDSVLSVAACTESLDRAWFSQRNSEVDIAAPGRQILSTAPIGRGYDVATVDIRVAGSGAPTTCTGKWLERSAKPGSNDNRYRNALFVECPDGGSRTCPGSGGHICVIERYVSIGFLLRHYHMDQTHE